MYPSFIFGCLLFFLDNSSLDVLFVKLLVKLKYTLEMFKQVRLKRIHKKNIDT